MMELYRITGYKRLKDFEKLLLIFLMFHGRDYTDVELSKTFSCSVPKIRKALNKLIREGQIITTTDYEETETEIIIRRLISFGERFAQLEECENE